MRFDFDINGRYEYPVIVLANPDFEELSIMEQLKDLTITPRFNAVSEMEFLVYKEYNGISLPYYERLLKNKLIHVIGFGWWIIDSCKETNDGGVPSKEVHCLSYEYTINYKGINLLNGTYKFYDLIKPEDSLLYKLISVLPNWKIGKVDSDLLNLYRTFDIPDVTLYGFLMNEVSNTYEVIFEFDTDNLLINAYSPKNVVNNTDIMLTFGNVNKNIDVSELSTDIYTVLRVNGADNLSISTVNPLGDNKLYDLSYYNNEEWIKDPVLRNKITSWQKDIEDQREPYSKLLNTLKEKNKELLKLKTELRDLQSELNALEIVRKNLTDQPEEFKKKTDEIDKKNLEIQAKEKEISVKEKEISNVKLELSKINELVRFDKYFTLSEQRAIDPFILESVYTDENFIVTDAMKTPNDANGDTLVMTTTGIKKIKDLLPEDILIDEQYISNQLLEHGRSVLQKVSQPSFEFNLDTTNFLFVEKFLPFIKQIKLGALINVEIKEGDWAYPVLLEMTLNYDDPSNFSMVFGNRFRLSSSEWTFAELYNEQAKVSAQVGSTLQVAAQPVLSGTINSMSNYMTNSLIAANQSIQSTVDNEVTIGGYGIRGRKKDDKYASGYDPHQVWINNELICMTDDNWQTLKLALGRISTTQDPNRKYYGFNAEIICGNLLAGNQLIIQDGTLGKESTFIVDANGCRLTNASFVLTTSDEKGKIVLNPSSGIHIQVNKSGEFKDAFYVDNNGFLMATDITAVGGTIGGFNITKDRLYSDRQISNPNSLSNSKVGGYVPVVDLRTDGTGNLGQLSWNMTNCRFEGDAFLKSGEIGGFLIGPHSITSKNNIIQLNDNGTGKISLMTWNTGSAWFDGYIYADNLDDDGFDSDVIDDKFVNRSFPHSKVDSNFDEAVGDTLRARRIFADYGEFNTLKAKAITTDNLSAIRISASQITSGFLSANRIQAGSIGADKINVNTFRGTTLWVDQLGAFNSISTQRTVACGTLEVAGEVYRSTFVEIDGKDYYVLAHR